MAEFAVGDIQGCLAPLRHLLDKVEFEPNSDTLWVAGDLVNRGPNSLETLRFIKSLPKTQIVLGNHDLHLLAAASGAKKLSRKDTLKEILRADDCEELLAWLREQKLTHHDRNRDITMVHAGIPPIWSIEESLSYSNEVESTLRSDKADSFFSNMYGNSPDTWQDKLEGFDRLRIITNYLTRMRFCSSNGKLELSTKTGPDSAPSGYLPWFAHHNHKCSERKIIFGHWASLLGKTTNPHFYALDTGCVWGGSLTLMNLDTFERTEHANPQPE